MNTETVIILNSEKHYELEEGDVVKVGDIYESTSGRYEEPPMKGFEIPDNDVRYFRPVDNVD